MAQPHCIYVKSCNKICLNYVVTLLSCGNCIMIYSYDIQQSPMKLRIHLTYATSILRLSNGNIKCDSDSITNAQRKWLAIHSRNWFCTCNDYIFTEFPLFCMMEKTEDS